MKRRIALITAAIAGVLVLAQVALMSSAGFWARTEAQVRVNGQYSSGGRAYWSKDGRLLVTLPHAYGKEMLILDVLDQKLFHTYGSMASFVPLIGGIFLPSDDVALNLIDPRNSKVGTDPKLNIGAGEIRFTTPDGANVQIIFDRS